VSESGSRFIIDHVITGLLNAEKEAATNENRRRTALTTANYNFTRDDSDADSDGSQYVLNVIPKNDNKFLYRGKIWIDAKDFAVTKIEAEPAKNPSFWIRKTEVRHRYKKIEGFWLPAENSTESSIRMGGQALLSIEYENYEIPAADQLNATEHGGENSNAPLTHPEDSAFH
jgi:ribonuclease HI